MTWTSVSPVDAEANWDSQLLQFEDQNLYQSFRWGTYKRIRGWTPRHFRAEMNGGVIAMLQALVRTYPLRTAVAWCPGGPVGALEACTHQAMEQITWLLGARSLYCRCTFARPTTTEDAQYLQSHGWTRPRRMLGANMTAVLDLTQSEEQLLAGLNRNWRYSLRQAQKSGLQVEHLSNPPVEELADLCTALHVAKGIPATAAASEVAALFDALGEQAVVYGCRNSSGELIAFHSCGMHGPRAWELIAATSPEGRRRNASFAALWALMLHCRRMNITHYDLAGVDSEKAPGVADFKRWTGAQDVEWLGEWEWSTSRALSRVVDVAVRKRGEAALP